MTKIRVQDATKELSANAGKMLENVTRLRKQSQEVLSSLRRISEGFAREAKEREEREAREQLQKQYEAAAQFMTAYSSEQAPEIPQAPQPEIKAEPVSVEDAAPAPTPAEAPATPSPAKPREERPQQPAPQARPQGPYGRPVNPPQGGQQPRPQGSYGRPVNPPQGGFPDDIKDIAGALLKNKDNSKKERLINAFLENFFEIYDGNGEYMPEYKSRSNVLGKKIEYIKNGERVKAKALDILDTGELLVSVNGKTEKLGAGEIKICTDTIFK